MDYSQKALELHSKNHGKLEVRGKLPAATMEDLSVAYTPGVAAPCLKIKEDPQAVYEYTCKGNLVGVISDGTAVLGLGDIGPKAAIPVMEGKSLLFKAFAGVDAIPLCLDSKDPDELVRTIQLLAPVLGGINLEDISAPRCFEIESRLQELLDIPVFHDDQHGTAVVVLAALLSALRLLKREISATRVVINGAGSAGIAIGKLLLGAGVTDLVMVDRQGILCPGEEWMNPAQKEMAEITNPRKLRGSLAAALADAHVFIGVSGPGVLTGELVKVMAPDPVIFAMANPVPEIMPDEALAAGAAVVGTGRSDFPNQINNVLAFPGIFRGALDVRARRVNEAMKVAAANAIASLVGEDELAPDHIIPSPFDPRLAARVAEYVARAALETGVAQRTDITPEQVYQGTLERIGK
jgi:malate dehydrogenase (oxaloacetate-decarboxylating)